jgi:murein tripeptide amidase MpaA
VKLRFLDNMLAGCLVLISAIGAQAAWYDNYQNLSSIYSKLDEFQTTYPDLVSSFSIGQSYEGREIRGIRISGTGGSKTTRPAVLLNGTQHAREWISPMTNMYAAEQLLSQYAVDSHVQGMLDEVDFYVIPVVNPDGYEFSWASPANRYWRKNRRDNTNGTFGVDLNRNWGTGWGGAGSSSNTLSETYRGIAPFSEPETQALRDFYFSHPNLVSNVDFHSFSQLILAPYGYSFTEEPADGELMLAVAGEMADSIFDVHGKTYVPQPATDLYQASGISIDWTYQSENVYSFTIELRPEAPLILSKFNLPADQILPTAEEAFAAVLDLGNFTATLAYGDFNYDQKFNLLDIDLLASGIVHGTSKAEYDINGDALIDTQDIFAWLQNAGTENLPGGRSYLPGDANLDGLVNGTDFDIWQANYLAQTSDWSRGDFNTDGIVDDEDRAIWALSVPEPASLALMLWACLLLCGRKR